MRVFVSWSKQRSRFSSIFPIGVRMGLGPASSLPSKSVSPLGSGVPSALSFRCVSLRIWSFETATLGAPSAWGARKASLETTLVLFDLQLSPASHGSAAKQTRLQKIS